MLTSRTWTLPSRPVSAQRARQRRRVEPLAWFAVALSSRQGVPSREKRRSIAPHPDGLGRIDLQFKRVGLSEGGKADPGAAGVVNVDEGFLLMREEGFSAKYGAAIVAYQPCIVGKPTIWWSIHGLNRN
jgi:hypothetical protein